VVGTTSEQGAVEGVGAGRDQIKRGEVTREVEAAEGDRWRRCERQEVGEMTDLGFLSFSQPPRESRSHLQ
jgi:hypothetical protein